MARDRVIDFQQVAGSMAQTVGMPPQISKWLGINASPFPASVPKLRFSENSIVVGDWVNQRPESCQLAVESHVSYLRSYPKDYGAYAEVLLIHLGIAVTRRISFISYIIKKTTLDLSGIQL